MVHTVRDLPVSPGRYKTAINPGQNSADGGTGSLLAQFDVAAAILKRTANNSTLAT